jgi:hypothetical protein
MHREGCSQSNKDSEQEELYALGREEHEASLAMAFNPIRITVDVPESSRRVTPSPDKEAKHYLSSEGKADGMEWENLDGAE